MTFPSLLPYGWGDRWAALLAELPDATPARVVRHDGAGLVLATPDGIRAVPLGTRLDPEPTVGDWVALDPDDSPIQVLPRSSLLRRASARGDHEQSLAANVDLVLLVCGLDRPVKPGRIQRGAALAWDAGAVPAVILTKAALHPDPDAVVAAVADANPGIDVLLTSAHEGIGLGAVLDLLAGRTTTVLGESGAGKSSLVNAVLGAEAEAIGQVRTGDAKGRHTTTSRHLHLVPGGGVIVDTPGLRAVGLWIDPDAVTETFADVADLADACRFNDCGHETEPGCAVLAAVESGELPEARLEAWRALRQEAEAAARRADSQAQRRYGRQMSKRVREAMRAKGDRDAERHQG